ncbi:hypothetical protein L4D00_24305 [Photobacterium swingsii]|uniref:hypothetical protein n=1 Tax=Photobacterium swingsii TaxID=680026 RepID=UPI003D0E0DB2
MNFVKFLEYLKANSGLMFQTISRKAEFTIRVDSKKLYFTPHSTMAERNSRLVTVSEMFDMQRDTGSFNTSHFKDVTVNASYILSLIYYFDSNVHGSEIYPNIDDLRAIEGYQIDSKLLQSKRNKSLAEKAKLRDNYTCQACGYRKEINGNFVIDSHHLSPLSSSGPVITELKDLICLCPNCHRVAHLKNPPHALEKIKSIVNA